MTDQPYQGGPYEGYDPYQQQPAPPQDWQGTAPQGAQGGYDPQSTQTWQGQTWETQTHAPVQAAEATAYMPPVTGYPQQGYQQGEGFAGTQVQPHYQQAGQPQPQHQYQQAAHPGPQPMAQPHPHPQSATPMPQPYPTAAPAPESAVGDRTAEEPSGDEPSYGPATLAGNSRITDAQRARLEGRSPIIEPGMQPALLTALLGLLLAAAAGLGSYALAVPLVLLQAVTAAGWFRLNGMWPARQGIALAFLGGLAADVAVLAAGRGNAPAAILGTLGVWVLLSLVLQLRSHASPDERMYGLMATVASAALAILATGYLGADPHAVSVGAAAVAVASLARALPLPTPASVVVALLAAAGAGIAVGGMTGLGTQGALLGALAGACALVGHRVAGYDYPSRFVHFTAGVALPLSAAAPVVWALGRVLG
ncbi:hypothetical protein [Streptomyces griseofuscus]|uniref:Uncharacterized protein n=1 Tax=Streptomyces griseofuscus TaxID=146922 RepID=A0A7H1Q288_9ACTN|nr:hypothetical protein [Streptomyces griseofuscus]QNT94418.1 hypothetical protein HEP81_04139 [Streptomyces griseofuscus]BBC95138.1 hypothetical protein SRO_3962 [Streptomyces rochei]